MRGAENSEVLPTSVAVARHRLAGSTMLAGEEVKETLPRPRGDELLAYEPLALVTGRVGVELDESRVRVLFSLPVMVVLALAVLAEEMTGKFCTLLGPPSGSFVSLAVLPAAFSTPPPMSMPSPPLEKMEFLSTLLFVEMLPSIATPSWR